MTNKTILNIGLVLILFFLCSSCVNTDANSKNKLSPSGALNSGLQIAGEEEEGLKISGLVYSPSVLTVYELGMMDSIEVVTKNINGEEISTNGVPIIVILGLAGVQDNATELIFRTSNGNQSQVLLQDLNACINCIVALRENGEFDVVLPGILPEAYLLGVVELVLN